MPRPLKIKSLAIGSRLHFILETYWSSPYPAFIAQQWFKWLNNPLWEHVAPGSSPLAVVRGGYSLHYTCAVAFDPTKMWITLECCTWSQLEVTSKGTRSQSWSTSEKWVVKMLLYHSSSCLSSVMTKFKSVSLCIACLALILNFQSHT